MKTIIDKFVAGSLKLANQIHLKSMRDAVALTMPLAILAGFMTLINSMILNPTGFLSNIINPETLAVSQEIGKHISNATLGMWSIAMTFSVAYCLARNRSYEDQSLRGLSHFAVLLH